MRLVTSIMTLQKLKEEEKSKIVKLFSSQYPQKMETFVFDYEENRYYEFDIDIFDVEFTKETIHQHLHELIGLYEKIMIYVSFTLDFIVGNDDISSAVDRYENNWNDIGYFGLFVTRRKIPNQTPYYRSDVCNAYVNFECVSFGCIF